MIFTLYFTTAQVAQKMPQQILNGIDTFTTAQVAQKTPRITFQPRIDFTTAQVAQKHSIN